MTSRSSRNASLIVEFRPTDGSVCLILDQSNSCKASKEESDQWKDKARKRKGISPEKPTNVDLANTLIQDGLDLLVTVVGGASLSFLTMPEANSSPITYNEMDTYQGRSEGGFQGFPETSFGIIIVTYHSDSAIRSH